MRLSLQCQSLWVTRIALTFHHPLLTIILTPFFADHQAGFVDRFLLAGDGLALGNITSGIRKNRDRLCRRAGDVHHKSHACVKSIQVSCSLNMRFVPQSQTECIPCGGHRAGLFANSKVRRRGNRGPFLEIKARGLWMIEPVCTEGQGSAG